MTRSPVVAHPDACLFQGAPAVAFVLRAAARPSYAAALDTLDNHIATLTRHRLDRAHERIERGQLPELREFDLINGLTGIGVYLLYQYNEEGDLLRNVLSYLVRLTEPLTVDGQVLPGWWTGNGPADQPSREWPGVISPAEWKTSTVVQFGPQRPSWCYGTPGLARAQQLAALALGQRRRQRHAEAALAACIADDTQLSQIDDASLCHGWAGVVQTTRRAAADAGAGSELAALLPNLHARWEKHLRRHRQPAHDGMLEGAAGIALIRGAVAPPASRWDACLLIASPRPDERSHMEGTG